MHWGIFNNYRILIFLIDTKRQSSYNTYMKDFVVPLYYFNRGRGNKQRGSGIIFTTGFKTAHRNKKVPARSKQITGR